MLANLVDELKRQLAYQTNLDLLNLPLFIVQISALISSEILCTAKLTGLQVVTYGGGPLAGGNAGKQPAELRIRFASNIHSELWRRSNGEHLSNHSKHQDIERRMMSKFVNSVFLFENFHSSAAAATFEVLKPSLWLFISLAAMRMRFVN